VGLPVDEGEARIGAAEVGLPVGELPDACLGAAEVGLPLGEGNARVGAAEVGLPLGEGNARVGAEVGLAVSELPE